MKLIQNSIFRALCAVTIGALLIKYRDEMVEWMTILIGILFFLSGLIAFFVWFFGKKKAKKKAAEIDHEDLDIEDTRASGIGIGAAIASMGSMILGLCLALMPTTFVKFLVYILSAFIILGAIQQFAMLAVARRNGKVGIGFWIMPSLLLIAGAVAVIHPESIASSPIFFIGWCMIVYGIVECINAIKSFSNRRIAEKIRKENENALLTKQQINDAEVVEYEEIKE